MAQFLGVEFIERRGFSIEVCLRKSGEDAAYLKHAFVDAERIIEYIAALICMVVGVHHDGVQIMLLYRDRVEFRMPASCIVITIKFDA